MAELPSLLVALSGGVDSSASLALLSEKMKKEGRARLEAAYIKTWMHEASPIGECSWREDIADATAVCEKLGVPFRVVNLIGEYETHVVKMLIDGYAQGITPNPDIACNRSIKFGAFLDYALKEGFTHVATGHYAQVRESPEPPPGRGARIYSLLEGKDPNKDQSYFLAQLTQAQLSRAIFPIGNLLKPEVRAIAQIFGLPNHAKKDSQGICFLGKVKINDFLRRYLPDKPGPIVNSQGREIGLHKGLHHYTIGQRHGMGIPSNADREHYVVIAKDFSANALRVAFDHHDTPGLYQTTLKLHHIHWVNPNYNTELRSSGQQLPTPPSGRGEINGAAPCDPKKITIVLNAGPYKTCSGGQPTGNGTRELGILARPRYRDPKVPATLAFDDSNSATITFSIPQRALASGQLVAFHVGNELIGSGMYV